MRKILVFCAVAALLGACGGDGGNASGANLSAVQQGPDAAQRCARDVALMTQTMDVAVLDARPGREATTVRIGVGPSRAPWTCAAYPDGRTADIHSLGG